MTVYIGGDAVDDLGVGPVKGSSSMGLPACLPIAAGRLETTAY